ncbi:sporangia induced 28 kDa inner dynein arm light chain [Phytophthora infestans T30-4]|uniref:Sporangia induced 28 kDa inner dynein arm light chain n=2 Tax=Phytophthora infestans TaxID=4787 RepID=D0NR71_PHYIT|nr:sporangia induced 28 kDa inner dynein arm light chain [Phytophthora infestans T30-4]EEY63193.1 sporangia induced 28 kDa inner dynein arm light chain [Phytophthora infestans T30-4]KAF4032920.1 Axonemal dynein light chain [Phytophthora infestans]|eukprot:XP_002898370.1 sporangia induced 28 kDa inner dynein arm light chain [Phytophthora infestans T30-4]
MIPPQSSLVKYNNPILVSSSKDKALLKGRKPGTTKNGNQPPNGDSNGSGAPPAPKPTVFTGSNTHSGTPTEDILNSILPPKEWTEDGQLWVQYVSSTPATRLDVVNLQEQLDLRLQQRQARETGICPVREELYAQCFDELIRQITINCSERGLLLFRVRDEARMTIAAYQTLYESSIAFGMRKALMAEQKKMEAEQQIRTLEGELRDLTSQIEELSTRCEAVARREEEKKLQDEKKHQEEVELLRKNNDQLKASLESMLAAPK